MGRAYFDWNATAPMHREVREAVHAALALIGNASSVHAEGRVARRTVEEARQAVAGLVGTEAENVTFTSGGTEANSLALTPGIEVAGRRELRDRLFISAIEHASVRAGGRYNPGDVEELSVTSSGIVDLDALRAALSKSRRPMVSVMLANNESGVIQPIAEVAQIVHAASGVLHVDAVQAPGRIECDIGALGADLLSISSHKIGGPQGAGALVRRTGIHIADPLIKGGGQERGLRAGTENVAAIAGFGVAASLVKQSDPRRLAALRDRFETGLKSVASGVLIFGDKVRRLPNTSLFTIPGLKAETAIIAFDLNGIAVSSGSACSSGKVQASHVLTAMGVEPAIARGAVRVSLGWSTTDAEIDALLIAWKKVVSSLSDKQANAA